MKTYDEASYQKDLERLFNFTSHELEENANGRMPETQIKKLQESRIKGIKTVALVFIGISALFLIPYYLLVYFGDMRFGPISFVFFWLAPIITLISILWSIVMTLILWNEREIMMIDGKLTTDLKVSNRGRNKEYFMEIGNRKFPINLEQYRGVIPNKFHSVYFIPKTKEILSVNFVK